MAVRGRKPKPTNLKVLEGNPGQRPLNENEPKPKPIAPDCPDWLADVAKEEWKRIAPQLETLGLLTQIDMAMLAGYCQMYARWKAAELILAEKGLTFETPSGYEQQRPEVSIAKNALSEMRTLAAEFGMSASSRTRISLPDVLQDDDPMEQLLGRR